MSDNPYGLIPPVRRQRRAWPWLAVLAVALTAVLVALWFVYGPIGLLARILP